MSHIVTIDVELTDITAIRVACKRLGWEFLHGKKTFRWYGQYVGDYRVFEQQLRDQGIAVEDYGKCDHAIRVPSANYEIGLVRKGNQFVPLWDFFDRGGLENITAENGMGGFLAAYAVAKATIEARKKGYAAAERKMPNGNVQVEVIVP